MLRSPEASASTGLTPNRRDVLAGAAWAFPAIAAASIAPAAAASGTTVLTFDRATYSGTVCADITGASVTVTVDGTAAPGLAVTVAASTGYRFDNGASTFTGLSDASGRVALPALRVQVAGTAGTLAATTTGATAAATLTSPANTATQTLHRRAWTATGVGDPSGTVDLTVPTGSRAVGTLVTLDPTGTLRRRTTTIGTGVTSAFAEMDKNNFLTVTSVDATGMHRRMWTDTGSAYPSANVDATVPANSIAVGTFVPLDPAGVLRRVGTTIATGVTSAFSEFDKGNYTSVTWVDGAGMHRRVWTDAGAPYPASNIDESVPTDSTAVGTLLTLSPDGVLRKGAGGVATGVTSVFAELDRNNDTSVTFVDATGMHRRMWTAAGAATTAGSMDAAVPTDSIAVGNLLTLGADGILRRGSDTVATGVTSVFAETDKNNATVVTWVDGAC